MIAGFALLLFMRASHQDPPADWAGIITGRIQAVNSKILASSSVTIRFSRPDGLCVCKWPTQTILPNKKTGDFKQIVPGLGYFQVCATAPLQSHTCTTIHVSKGETVPVVIFLSRDHPQSR